MEIQRPESFLKGNPVSFRYRFCAVLVFFLTAAGFPAGAADRYTDQQLDALASRVSKIYWIVAINNQTPPFLSSPATNATSFHAQPNESFEITELVGRKDKIPYYKVKFNSGKEGYIQPEVFLEELNASISAFDPKASEKKKAAEAAEEEKKRIGVSKVKGRLNLTEERWLYADGSTAVFLNGLLSRIEPKPNNNP